MNQIDIFQSETQNPEIKEPEKTVKMVPFFENNGETPPGILCACTDCGRYSRYCECLVEDGQQWDVSTKAQVGVFIKLIEAA